MKNLIKSVKKLSPKKDDILVVTLTGAPTIQNVEQVRDSFLGLSINTRVIILDERIRIKYQNENKGKHIVYMTNLEYLEWIDKNKEIQ